MTRQYLRQMKAQINRHQPLDGPSGRVRITVGVSKQIQIHRK